MTQGTFQSFTDPNSSSYKSPEERKQYTDVLTKINGVWKHGSLNIGLSDDQAIVWLKENADKIRISKLEAQVNEILAKLPK